MTVMVCRNSENFGKRFDKVSQAYSPLEKWSTATLLTAFASIGRGKIKIANESYFL